MKALKLSIICSFSVSAVFALFSLIFYFGDWARLSIVATLGLFIGLLAAPEIDPKAYKRPWLIQIFSGAVAGALIAYGFEADGETIVMSSALGAFVGLTAFLTEIGIIPIMCASGGKSGRLAKAINEAAPFLPEVSDFL